MRVASKNSHITFVGRAPGTSRREPFFRRQRRASLPLQAPQRATTGFAAHARPHRRRPWRAPRRAARLEATLRPFSAVRGGRAQRGAGSRGTPQATGARARMSDPWSVEDFSSRRTAYGFTNRSVIRSLSPMPTNRGGHRAGDRSSCPTSPHRSEALGRFPPRIVRNPGPNRDYQMRADDGDGGPDAGRAGAPTDRERRLFLMTG
jgi:hypothetical protein